MNTIILLLSTLSVGLMAGLFYAWSISLTPGLKKVSDTIYLQAFKSMNRAIINPVFLIIFISLGVNYFQTATIFILTVENNWRWSL
jgi:uncharacterized membrane protein